MRSSFKAVLGNALVVIVVFQITMTNAFAAKKTAAQTAAKTCIEGKNWYSDAFGKAYLASQLQSAKRPAKSQSLFLMDPSLGGLATALSSTNLRFSRGRLTGSADFELAGVTSENGGLRGRSSAVLDARYSLSISKKGAITISIKTVAIDQADTKLFLYKFSTFEELNSVDSVQTPFFLKDVQSLKASCKGKVLKITFPNESVHTFNR